MLDSVCFSYFQQGGREAGLCGRLGGRAMLENPYSMASAGGGWNSRSMQKDGATVIGASQRRGIGNNHPHTSREMWSVRRSQPI
jgi:hypothetical protein